MTIEGIDYQEIYGDVISPDQLKMLDFIGVEWRGRNIKVIEEDIRIKMIQLANLACEEISLHNPDQLSQTRAFLDYCIEQLFNDLEEVEETDVPNERLCHFDPISGTYRVLIAAEKNFISHAAKKVREAGRKARKIYKEHKKAVFVTAALIIAATVIVLTQGTGTQAAVAGVAAAAATPSSSGRKKDEDDKKSTPPTGSSSPQPPPSKPAPTMTAYNFNPPPSFLSTSSNSIRAEGLIPPISTLSNPQSDFSPPIYQSTIPVDRNIPVTLPIPPHTFPHTTPTFINQSPIPLNVPSSVPPNTFLQITPTFLNQGPISHNVPIPIISPPYQSPFQNPLPNSALSQNWKKPTPPSNHQQSINDQKTVLTPPSSTPISLIERFKNIFRSPPLQSTLSLSDLFQDFLNIPPAPKSFEIPGKKLVRGAIGGINGMGNYLSEAKANANYLAQMSNGHQIDWVYNRTNLVVFDMLEVALLNFKGISQPAKILLEEWMKFHEKHKNDPTAKYLQVCHSQGAIHVKNALENAPQEVRDCIIVLAIAPAAIIPKELCFDSFNYASKKDPIPLAEAAFNYDADASYEERMAEPSRQALKELILLEPHPDAKDHDHNLDSPTFKPIISDHFEKHIKKYGDPQ